MASLPAAGWRSTAAMIVSALGYSLRRGASGTPGTRRHARTPGLAQEGQHQRYGFDQVIEEVQVGTDERQPTTQRAAPRQQAGCAGRARAQVHRKDVAVLDT